MMTHNEDAQQELKKTSWGQKLNENAQERQ